MHKLLHKIGNEMAHYLANKRIAKHRKASCLEKVSRGMKMTYAHQRWDTLRNDRFLSGEVGPNYRLFPRSQRVIFKK